MPEISRVKDWRLKYAVMREGGQRAPWFIHEVIKVRHGIIPDNTRRHHRPDYTKRELEDLADWLNKRAAGYPVPVQLAHFQAALYDRSKFGRPDSLRPSTGRLRASIKPAR